MAKITKKNETCLRFDHIFIISGYFFLFASLTNKRGSSKDKKDTTIIDTALAVSL